MIATLDDVITERIAFFKQQLAAEDDPTYIRSFQAQIKILQTAQLVRLDELIALKRHELKARNSLADTDRLFSELEALEWLQRQVARRA